MPVLDLTVSRQPDGRSRLKRRHASFPWSLGRGYPGAPDEPVLLIPQMAGAGLLAGDHLTQHLRVETGAGLHLVSAGAMLVYGAPGGSQSVSEWEVNLSSYAKAFLVSEPYVLFDDADFKLRQVLIVAPDATLIGCEGIVCAEPCNLSRWQTETVVRRPDGTHLFTDRQRVSPETLSRQFELAGAWSAFGTLMILGPQSERQFQETDDHICALITQSGCGVWIASAPTRAGSGTCIRIAAKDGQKLRFVMMKLVSRLMRSTLDA